MIYCKAISKSYDQQKVLSDFTYLFPQRGFVLLYGKSGCGKTTLLNIMAGFIPFDKGHIIFQNDIYQNRVEWDKVSSNIGYITQDTHFIDYLTVLDNLKLSSTDDEAIMELLDKFGLKDNKDSYPNTLSGGEKQRVAIIQALVGEKNILLLDEPTASLDRENKTLIFKMLEQLKSSKLIICSSHDNEAKQYADQIIDFNRPETITSTEDRELHTEDIIPNNTPKKRTLLQFFKKQYKYPGREKKSRLQLIAVFFLAVLALSICDTPANKLNSNIKYTYRLNQLQVRTRDVNQSLLMELGNNKHVKEVNLIYNKSVPDGTDNVPDGGSPKVTYDLNAETIPFNADAFRLSRNIQYGSYFTKPEQVILSYDKALSLGSPEDLIGETLKVELYDQIYHLEIVGVFREFTEIEKKYLQASGVYFGVGSETIFINGEFTKRYIEDKDFLNKGSRLYTIYFDTFDNMKAYYDQHSVNENGDIFVYDDVGVSMLFLFEGMFAVLFPLVLTVIPLSVLLYYQTWKIKMIYNKHILAVYQYLGYSAKEMKRCSVITSLEEVVKMLIIATAAAIPVMWIINLVNLKMVIAPFQVFTHNIFLILLLGVIVSLLSIIVSFSSLNKVGMAHWYQVLLEKRDLI